MKLKGMLPAKLMSALGEKATLNGGQARLHYSRQSKDVSRTAASDIRVRDH
jgi:hypothetical protein